MPNLLQVEIKLSQYSLINLGELARLYSTSGDESDLIWGKIVSEMPIIRAGWSRVVERFEAGDREYEVQRLCKDLPNAAGTLVELPIVSTDKMLRFLKASVEATRNLKDVAGEANRLGKIGLLYSMRGDCRKAIKYHRKHLQISRKLKSREGEGVALDNLGAAHVDVGRFTEALGFYQERLAIALELGDRSGESKVLGNVGVVYNKLGLYERAREYHERRIKIAGELGDRRGVAQAVGNLAVSMAGLRDFVVPSSCRRKSWKS